MAWDISGKGRPLRSWLPEARVFKLVGSRFPEALLFRFVGRRLPEAVLFTLVECGRPKALVFTVVGGWRPKARLFRFVGCRLPEARLFRFVGVHRVGPGWAMQFFRAFVCDFHVLVLLLLFVGRLFLEVFPRQVFEHFLFVSRPRIGVRAY